jgi:FG-GAP-like repeat
MLNACSTTGGGSCIAAKVAVKPSVIGGFIGDTIQFKATSLDQNGNVCGSAVIAWTTDAASIVSINSSGLATILFDGNALDYPATVTIMATDGVSDVSGGSMLTASNPVASVVITSPSPPTLTACESFQFTAEARDVFNAPLANIPIVWNSSDPSVSIISNTGQATATGDGSADMTATAYGIQSVPTPLDVNGGSPITIAVTAPSFVPAGSSGPVTATVVGFSVDDSVTWSVDGGSTNGTVTPLGPKDADYSAPITYAGFPGTTLTSVRATSNENPACSATADVTVVPTFHAAVQYGAGGLGDAQALSVGHFSLNSSNNLDVAVVNQNGYGVSIWQGDGTGHLSLVSEMLTQGTGAIAKGFFDAGVLPDLAVLNLYLSTVSFLLGTGGGSFAPANPQDMFLGYELKSLVGGDFDLDGDDDLAVASYSTNWPGVMLLRNDGNGVFTNIGTRVLFGNPFMVRKGLINDDNLADLAVSNFTGDKIQFMTGDGTMNFGPNPQVLLPAGTGPADIAIADFNGGSADLAIVNRGQLGDTCPPPANPEADKVTILLGHGDFTFDPPSTVAVGSNPRSIATGDFNKDGNVDLVVTNFCDDTISILFGNGDGTFQPAISYTLGQPGLDRPTAVAIGDLNNDTYDDIIVTNSGTDSVAVLLNNN